MGKQQGNKIASIQCCMVTIILKNNMIEMHVQIQYHCGLTFGCNHIGAFGNTFEGNTGNFGMESPFGSSDYIIAWLQSIALHKTENLWLPERPEMNVCSSLYRSNDIRCISTCPSPISDLSNWPLPWTQCVGAAALPRRDSNGHGQNLDTPRQCYLLSW